jgi:hypothetical protein
MQSNGWNNAPQRRAGVTRLVLCGDSLNGSMQGETTAWTGGTMCHSQWSDLVHKPLSRLMITLLFNLESLGHVMQ